MEMEPTVTDFQLYIHPIDDNFMYVFGALMLLTSLVAIGGNAVLIFAFMRESNLRKKAANIYTINLALGNFLLGFIAGSIAISIFNKIFVASYDCTLNGFFITAIHISVIMTITALIADRYHVICHGKTSCKFIHEKPFYVTALIWIYSILWGIPPLTAYVPDYIKEPLMPCCVFDRFTKSLINRLYIILMCCFVLFIPFVFICYCLAKIFQTVQLSTKLLKQYKGKRMKRKAAKKSSSPTSNRDQPESFYALDILTSKQNHTSHFPEIPLPKKDLIRTRSDSSKTNHSANPIVKRRASQSYSNPVIGSTEVILPEKYLNSEHVGHKNVIQASCLDEIIVQNSQHSNLEPQTSTTSETPMKRISSRFKRLSSKCNSESSKSMKKRVSQSIEFSILKSAIILIALFVSSWLPFAVTAILNQSGYDINSYVVMATYLFAKASCVHSSLAYITNTHFRATIGMLQCWGRRKVKNPPANTT